MTSEDQRLSPGPPLGETAGAGIASGSTPDAGRPAPAPDQQGRFDGWAIVEIFGHQRFAGRVSTEAFGQSVMWRVDVPELPAIERTLAREKWVERINAPEGTVVREDAVPGYTKLFGSGAIYCITPCTEQAAMAAVGKMVARPLSLVKLPEGYEEPKALPPPDWKCRGCEADLTLGEDHEDGCAYA